MTWQRGGGGQKQLEIHQMFTGEVDFSNFYFHISFCYYFLVALQWPCIDERVKKQNMFFWNNAPSVTAFLRYLSTDSIQIFPASRPLPYTPDPLLSGLLSSYPSPSLSSGCDFSSPWSAHQSHLPADSACPSSQTKAGLNKVLMQGHPFLHLSPIHTRTKLLVLYPLELQTHATVESVPHCTTHCYILYVMFFLGLKCSGTFHLY